MDRYYTPEPLARELLQQSSFEPRARRVIDPSCGSGALLSAAETVLGADRCEGIDLDKAAIRVLRRTRPHWCLSVADFLCERSMRRLAASDNNRVTDLLLLNPPFSQARSKFSEYRTHEGSVIKVGRAMHFLLRAVDIFDPVDGVVAIVPESLVYSEIDDAARRLLDRCYQMNEVAQLKSTTFRGARVRAVAVELKPRANRQAREAEKTAVTRTIDFERGSLPVHRAEAVASGVPFIHSTNLVDFSSNTSSVLRVEPGRIQQKGWGVLLPRVGVPSRKAARARFIAKPVRLSDCVIALWCADRSAAKSLESLLGSRWDDLVGLYRGTGARYVTVARMLQWLESEGILAHRL